MLAACCGSPHPVEELLGRAHAVRVRVLVGAGLLAAFLVLAHVLALHERIPVLLEGCAGGGVARGPRPPRRLPRGRRCSRCRSRRITVAAGATYGVARRRGARRPLGHGRRLLRVPRRPARRAGSRRRSRAARGASRGRCAPSARGGLRLVVRPAARAGRALLDPELRVRRDADAGSRTSRSGASSARSRRSSATPASARSSPGRRARRAPPPRSASSRAPRS